MAGLLETLHDLRLNILAVDFRGHGESGGTSVTFGRRDVDDLLQAEAFLRERFPGQPVFLIGISYGASVILQALPRVPGVCGVWSEACFSRLDDVIAEQLAFLPDGLREAVTTLYRGAAWLDCGVWSSDVRLIDFGGGAQVPVSFCHGEADALASWGQAQELYERYPGPKSCYWVPGASHYHLRQLDREEYLRRLREFIGRQLSGRESKNILAAEPGSQRAAAAFTFRSAPCAH